jgi:ABC-type multidrug transport system fused ATPase/permease subunit
MESSCSKSHFFSYLISVLLITFGILLLVVIQPDDESSDEDVYRILLGSLVIVYSFWTATILLVVQQIPPQISSSSSNYSQLLVATTLASQAFLGICLVTIGLTISSNNSNLVYLISFLRTFGCTVVTSACIGLMACLMIHNNHHHNHNNNTIHDNDNHRSSCCSFWRRRSKPTRRITNDMSEPLLLSNTPLSEEFYPTTTNVENDSEEDQQQPQQGNSSTPGSSSSSYQDSKQPKGIYRLLKLAGPQRLLLTVACIVLLIRLPFSLAMPHLVSTTFLYLTSTSTDHYSRALGQIGRMVIVGTVDAVLDFWCVYLFGLANLRVTKHLRLDLYQTILGQEMSFFDATSSGELTSRLTADCGQMASDLTWVFRFSVEAIVRVAIIIAYLLLQCPTLGAITVAIIPIVAIINQRYGYFLQQNSTRVQTALAEANSVAQEAFSCIRTVLAFASEDLEYGKYRNKMDTWYGYNRIALYVTSCYYMLVPTFLCNTITQSAILYAGVILIQRGELTPQILLSFMLYQGQLQDYTQQLLGSYTTLLRSSGVGDAVFALLDRVPSPPGTGNQAMKDNGRTDTNHHDRDINNNPNDSALVASNEERDEEVGETLINEEEQQEQQQMIRRKRKCWNKNTINFEGVDFFYPTRPLHKVLSNITLSIPSGQTVALVGPSGCGKSTIVALIERLYDPVEGSVLIGGIDLRELDLKEHRHSIGIVTQDPVLFSGTILSNITYGEELGKSGENSDSDDREMMLLKRAKEVAKLANAHEFIESFADGYYTQVGERGVGLSGGQKQRIAIARAIWKRPSILLLDEATSALDTKSERLVQEALDRLLFNAHDGNVTTVVIAHRLQTVRNADSIVVISQGRIVEQGSHSELLQITNGFYHKMIHSSEASTGLLQADGFV